MTTEPEIITTEERPYVGPCPDCGVPVATRYVIRGRDPDGNVVDSMAVDLCSACEAELERRMAESKVLEAQAKARYEKSLADLINSIPKPKHEQAKLDLGLD